MPCLIDDSTSDDFVRQRKTLQKTCPNITADLARLYEDIQKNYSQVPQAHAIPGYKGKVWKYRCESTDLRRGKSGSFRVIGFYREADNTMYMICVYLKKIYDQPPFNDLKRWIKAVARRFPEETAGD